MAKRNFGDEFGFQTRAVHTGNDVDSETGAIKRPITMANSYELPYDPSDLNWSSAGKNLYTRNGGSNQQYLQEKLASLEGGEDCVVLASGVAALSGLFFALLKSGDHVVFSSVTYIAVYRLLNELLKDKFGVETTIVDTTDIEKVKAAIRPNTKLIHIETPGNPTLSISDIEKIAELAHANGALLSVDNTFASPFNQRPINLGATISPFNAWLIMRGSVTLPLRMKQHNENALKVARYLKTVKGVSFVAYPGLEDHPNHDVAVKQMKNGFGGVLSFGLKADHDTYNRFVTHLKVITSAVSLGHDESLIVFLGENDERQYLYPEEFHNGFFRFSVGIEDAEDIIEDLRQAFEKENLI
ncbi:trans-sulfuration enzyme family protein [Ruminococcoides intestinale]|uniref:trans-sulfuration enzyme family protein n=1 Tax=Ruminococcoides intestinale TaxID=3133162 RepID=UPI0032D3CFE7